MPLVMGLNAYEYHTAYCCLVCALTSCAHVFGPLTWPPTVRQACRGFPRAIFPVLDVYYKTVSTLNVLTTSTSMTTGYVFHQLWRC